MQDQTSNLREVAQSLFSANEFLSLCQICARQPLNYGHIISFDQLLGGPSILGVACNGSGRYAVEDRDIFRPLQYVSVHFHPAYRRQDLEWQTRDVVEMSSVHIEGLIKRIGNVRWLPLGRALREAMVKAKVDSKTWQLLAKYNLVYNNSKHKFNHEKDTHLFSVEDALLAYFCSRLLGFKLYPLANLVTDLKVFQVDCDESGDWRLSDPNAYRSD